VSRQELPADTLPRRLLARARAHPGAVAMRVKQLGLWREHTWRDYLDRVAEAARALWELGVRPGDSVAILSDNRPEWLFADLGAQSVGARAVGIYQTNPPEDVAYVLTDSGSKVLFCEDQEQYDKAVAIRAQTPGVAHVVVFDPRGTLGSPGAGDERRLTWEELLARGRALLAGEPGWYEARLAESDPHAPAMVVYTSGTTGPPKGAMLSSANVLEPSDRFVAQLGVRATDTVLSYLPLCHVAEKIFSVYLAFAAGVVVHFGESIDTVQTDLREVAPTVFLGVPRIWEKMAAAVHVRMQNASWLKRTLYRFFTARGRAIAARRLAGRTTGLVALGDAVLWLLGYLLVFRPLRERLGLRRCWFAVTGAAPISPDLLAWFHGIGVPICEGYGMTECAGVSHYNPPGAQKLGTVGTTVPLIEHRVAEDGEILLRGPQVFCGYLGKPEATAEIIDEQGWLHTGDIGEIDAGGYLRITGRKKDIIITAGGKNLSPEKIENALKGSPYIKEAVAIGDRRKFVGALVQIELDTVADWATRRQIPYTSFADLSSLPQVRDLIAAEIQRANDHLAPVEQVRQFRLLPRELNQDEGELTATQKVKRRAVQERYADLVESLYA
jgi:long-chain acyl-CoA synthetase